MDGDKTQLVDTHPNQTCTTNASHFALGKILNYLTFKLDNDKQSEGHYKVSFALTLALHALDALKQVWSNQEVFPQCQKCFIFCN